MALNRFRPTINSLRTIKPGSELSTFFTQFADTSNVMAQIFIWRHWEKPLDWEGIFLTYILNIYRRIDETSKRNFCLALTEFNDGQK